MGEPRRRRALSSAPLPGPVGSRGGVSDRTQGQEPGPDRDQIRAGGCAASEQPAGALAGGDGSVASSSDTTFRSGPVAVGRHRLSICRDGIRRPDARGDPASSRPERGGSARVTATCSGCADLSASTAARSWPAEALELSGGWRSAQAVQRHHPACEPGSRSFHRWRCVEFGRDAVRGAHEPSFELWRSFIRYGFVAC